MPLSPTVRQQKKAEFVAQAQAMFETMFDPDRQEQLITFTQREEEVLKRGRQLEAWLLEQHLAADPLAAPTLAESVRCPRCRAQGAPDEEEREPVPRRLRSRTGAHEFARRKYRCPSCETVFFPLGRALGSGAGRPESGAGAEGGAPRW
jgi:uncharacterized protein with PIN domain